MHNQKKVKFDVIVYGDFGKNPTSQARNMEEIIRILTQRGQLGNVICRKGKQSGFIEAIPGGAFFPKIITFFERITGRNLRFYSQNLLFDYFASKQIKSKCVISSVGGLRACLKRTHQIGGLYIEMELMENPSFFIKKLEMISEKFGLQIQNGTRKFFQRMDETSKAADYLVVVSEHVKQTFLGLSERIFVSRLGIAKNIKKRNLTEHRKKRIVLLYLAHTQILKGLPDLLSAWKKIGRTDVELWIGGTIDADTRRIIKKWRKLPNVRWLGNVVETQSIYEQSDLFILPSYSEGLAKVVLEAMNMSLPVILTDECGVAVEHDFNAFIVEAGNVKQIKEQIEFCLNNWDSTEKVALEGKKNFDRNYTKEVYSSRLEQIIEEIVKAT